MSNLDKKTLLKHINLTEIKEPSFLGELSYTELDLLCEDIRKEIIDAVSKNGGHLASNLGAVESTVALCKCFDFTKDKLIFDVGHQSYTYKILTGRSLERLRKKGGISGFQKCDESPFDHFECGHSSTSISAAHGMAAARDIKGENHHVIAYIGDASIVNGQSLEALNNIGQGKNKVIIILNDNDMAITKPVGALAQTFKGKNKRPISFTIKHPLNKANLFFNFGFEYIGPIDGHNIAKMEKAFAKAKESKKPVLIHLKTIKGKGLEYAENDSSGKWHGVSKFDKESGQGMVETVTWSNLYGKYINELFEQYDKTHLVASATWTGSSLKDVFTNFPQRCTDVGIAEEHAITYAAGLSSQGIHPIISIYSTFLQRGYDQLSHDLARMNLKSTVLIDRAGLVGEDGNTHQGLYDEQFLLGIPNTIVAMASRPIEAKCLLVESLKGHGVFCIRLPKEEATHNDVKPEIVQFGKWKRELVQKVDTAIVSVGPITVDLKDYIIKNNIKASLFNAIYQKPMDLQAIYELLDYQKIIIYDVYATDRGFATYLAAKLAQMGYKGKVIIKSVQDTFVEHATIKEQRQEFGLDFNTLIKLID